MLDESPSKFITPSLKPSRQKVLGASISAIAIRRHIGTLMLAIALIVIGLFFISRLQVDLLPAITYPRIGLRADAAGISPQVAVEEVTKPLEEALSATEGVVQIFSQTREGRISIDLFFEPGGDIDQALNDATATLNRARDRLPDIIEEPRLFKFDPSQLPIYEFALESSLLSDVELRTFADEEFSRELGIIPGVSGVDVSGGLREEIRINIDLNRLQALGVSLQNVLDALQERNQDIAGGRLEGEAGEPLTRTVGRFHSIQELRDLSLEIENNSDTILGKRRIYLRDVAEIIDGSEDRRVFVTLNGKPAVKVSIQKQPDANTIEVVKNVKNRIEFLQEAGVIPAEMEMITTLDESRFIQNSIRNVVQAGLTGTILAAIAVFVFLGSLRQTLIIVAAIPLATLTAIVLMKLFGLSINVFSLGGLALGVGIVVDNSIVMLENIADGIGIDVERERRTYFSSPDVIEMAQVKAQQVESALIASTLTNLVAVLPFLLIGGFISLLFNELILTISFAVAASLLLALTLVPMLASRLLAIPASSGINKFWFFRQFNRQFSGLQINYTRLLSQVIRFRILAILLAFLLLGGGSWWMQDRIPREILPPINTGQAQLIVQFPPGTTLEANKEVMDATNRILKEQPETDYIFTTVGGFLFGNLTISNLLRSSSTITVKPETNLPAFIARVSKEFQRLNLVNTRLRLVPERVRGIILSNSPIFRADLDIMLQGSDEEMLKQVGDKVLKILDENAKLARFSPDADAPQPEVRIIPQWERLASLGLNTENVGDTIQTAIQGTVSTQLQRGDRLIDIRVQLGEEYRQRTAQLMQIPLFTNNNRPVRLEDVVTLEEGDAPAEIQRINQRQVFIIAGNLNEGASLSGALAEVSTILETIELPSGVRFLPSTTAESNQQLQNSLKLLGGLAIFLVFVVMAVQYNSLIDPFVIILTVPLALAGGILGLYITQTAIGATVLVGAVLLVGIVVNNAIIMVELANQIRTEYECDRATAILKAAPQRLRPILMTTITTVLGLFPLALGLGEGSEFLQPLGIVVFSGLSVATVLTLFIIPCFYVLLHPSQSVSRYKP
ncbi:efflux RND transporter permease subunit [Spirulina sp. 06S082]|uniref:efflux RND transporter permease subunit n=1 Tax=Spirulina sp. 06S082 TaxID=3110248 RepID=UPI002B211828|nr:efflux RND transporter permease subunit [Spirulina sp. 06S082]MEA5468096.1 efflux RND transporter permease subunit [Spirulina sp. 06S082]